MVATVTAVKERLAEIQETITGVKRAYANGPKMLPSSDLPIFVNFTGPASTDFNSLGADDGEEARTYIMRLYVAPTQQGISGEAEAACEPYFERVRDKFASRPGLGMTLEIDGPLAGIQMATFLGDNGVVVMSYAGQEYIGIEFRILVESVFGVTYDDYE